jgi:iron-sulfur cluster repair protein YtfE (RIC family)
MRHKQLRKESKKEEDAAYLAIKQQRLNQMQDKINKLKRDMAEEQRKIRIIKKVMNHIK